MKRKIDIFDTTLRDGEQSPGFSMNLEEKIRLALQLERLQVDIIEAGFPFASEGDFMAVREVAKRIKNCMVAGLARTTKSDIDRAWGALKYAKDPRIHTFIASSDLHMKHKLKKSRSQVLDYTGEAVRYSRTLCDNVEFSPEDASRSDRDFLCEVVKVALDEGAQVINVPCTVGYSMPWEFGALIKYLNDHVPGLENVTVSVHCHNDLGMAVANSIAGIKNGAGQVECTINGIGERAGNASLEEIVMILRARHEEFDADTEINTRELYPTSELLAEITGIGVQPNKAIVGRNAFAHEAGIHQDGMLKNPLTYEIMTPESVGVPASSLIIGKHSGRHAIAARLVSMGFNLTDEMLKEVYEETMKFADANKIVRDDDLKGIAKDYLAGKKEAIGM